VVPYSVKHLSEHPMATARPQEKKEVWEEGRATNLDQVISYALEDAEGHT
jgi:hypothetical protein